MSRTILSLICILLFLSAVTYSEETSLWTILESLRSNDPNKIERSCRLLGLERGAVGLSRIQLLQSSTRKSPQAVNIITISWEGPYDGYVMIVDRRGEVLARKSLGFIKNTCLRSLKGVGDNILVIDAIRGTGTGVREDRLSVVAVTERGFDVLWEGLSYEKSFPRQLAPDDNYEVKCSLSFDDVDGDGIDEIIYNIKRIKYSYNPETQKLLPDGEEKTSKVYKLIGGKYEFFKEKE